MCRVCLGIAINPTSGYGTSRDYLVNNEEKRSVSALNNPHTAYGTPGCWKLGIVWSFSFVCGWMLLLPPGPRLCEQAHS